MHTTVLVVGGGATGVGVARDLALRGVDTTLVERGALAAGTTGRSHGVLHSGARYAEADPDDAAACLAENRVLRDIAPDCIDETGGYFLQLDGDDPSYFERKREACDSLGMAVETLSGDALRDRVPEANPRVERALAVPDGVVSPASLVLATAAAAREAGAELYTHSPVEDVHVADGVVTGATVGGRLDARIEADVVVNATGPWAERCAALAGVDVPMAPTRGVMVAVDNPGVDAVLNRCRPPDDGDIVVPRDGTAVLGTTSVAVDDPDDFERTEHEIERTVAECAAMCPGVDAEVRDTYWGVRPLYAPDEAARDDARKISRGFALLDHAADGAAGLVTVVGGKLTTYRRMAEATADRVCERLGVDAECRTAKRALPASDDPAVADLRATLGVDAPAN
ncbi:glycerol-3-phosphate dehydrogenase [Haloplanus vescus]|uniref:Glycerol-3-phosphate dehydrogenase n=1 Tax=Haloplanus vescus TaxID=555874 RepID=A0A1H3YKN6_9EURY|nr:FAD-dependent oxidoreductase [Haloplanus vescus]SEA12007.1 glycerol-3-phosphate dehydrogenase [Haloplanus vescus]